MLIIITIILILITLVAYFNCLIQWVKELKTQSVKTVREVCQNSKATIST